MEAAGSSETLVNMYLTIEWHLRRLFLQVNCSHSKCLSLKVITLRLYCMMLQWHLTALKSDRDNLERSLLILQEGILKEKLKAFKGQGQENIMCRDEVCTRHSPWANWRYSHGVCWKRLKKSMRMVRIAGLLSEIQMQHPQYKSKVLPLNQLTVSKNIT